MRNIWGSYNLKDRQGITNCYVISRFLEHVNAIPEGKQPRRINHPQNFLTKKNVPAVKLYEDDQGYVIKDTETRRVVRKPFTHEELVARGRQIDLEEERVGGEEEEGEEEGEEEEEVEEEEDMDTSPPLNRGTHEAGTSSGTGSQDQLLAMMQGLRLDYQGLRSGFSDMETGQQLVASQVQRMEEAAQANYDNLWSSFTGIRAANEEFHRQYTEDHRIIRQDIGEQNRRIAAMEGQMGHFGSRMDDIYTGVQSNAYYIEKHHHEYEQRFEAQRSYSDYSAALPYMPPTEYTPPDFMAIDPTTSGPVRYPPGSSSSLYPPAPDHTFTQPPENEETPRPFQGFIDSIFGRH